ncbi:hypothetical protein HRbin02_01681 [Candidatus Calditenuaceae archaeon HR02]|nr:hypothetical protein HRbin02_01681 [Candidatus Calditenuaceae archaeon HR02]
MKKVTRRQAISRVSAVGAIIGAGVIGGIGGYLAGTTTGGQIRTVTETVGGATITQTRVITQTLAGAD